MRPLAGPRLALALAALGVAGALHLARLPLAISVALGGAIAWRWLAAQRSWAMPARWLKLLLALSAAFSVLATYRTLNGLAAGTALLALMAALKLTETRTPRDLGVLFFIATFLAYAAVLADGSPVTVVLVMASGWLSLAALLALARPDGADAPVAALGLTGRALLLGIPVAVVLFLFVPRIEGRFWALPADGRAVTGLSDEMRPGDISELSLSDAPAFRVFFSGPLPTRADRYWRGPVLHDFDGTTWRAVRNSAFPAGDIAGRGAPVSYRVLLEPTQRTFLPALELPSEWEGISAARDWDLTLYSARPVTSPVAYSVTSQTRYLASPQLPASLSQRALRWPEGTNPRTYRWAQELRTQHADDAALLQAVLRRFSEPPFAYTLTPPKLDRDAVDEFLFETRRGFCGHYASAFVAIARAAGIPARVVTGYLGGEWNRVGGYLLVRQSDAHAWAEVWLEGRGWVRMDPTGAVAPERIERGIDGALGEEEPVPGRLYADWPWLGDARAWLDAARTAWQSRFLEFDRQAQADLAERLGLGRDGLRSLLAALTIGIALASLALAVWVALDLRARWPDATERAWRRACRRVARQGLPRAPHEGPLDYARRVATARPDLGPPLQSAAEAYVARRYYPPRATGA